jgi:ATP-dependent helicase/nuclease subunit B
MEPMQLDAAETLLTQLRAAFAPLVALARQGACDIADIAAHHRDAIDALSRDASGRAWAFEGGDGRALADSFDDLAALGRTGLAVTAADYPDVFAELVGGRAVRPPPRPDIRLRVLGPLEARLIETDRVILGGLIEGVWPPAPQGDAWLSRPMRQELGLDLPERRIGLSAHDFAQLLGAGDVVLTHAARAGGAPAVASRFLHRLEAVAGAARWTAATARGARYVALAQTLDRPASGVTPIPRPEPKPPVAARPTRLSVTEIEDWMRDPYTIYARHILRLAPLDPVDMPLSAADRGSAIHNALADYSAGAAADPAQAERLLLRIGADHFAPLMARPEARALWWPRFRRIAAWFAGWDVARRADLDAVFAEIRGSLIIGEGPRAFRLTSRADRIERRADGAYAIVDFKTGKPPSGKQVRLGLSPQLTLEAAILRRGGFDGIAAGASVADLTYVRLSGNEPAGEQCTLALAAERGEAPQSPDEAAEEAYAKLAGLIRRFEDPTQAYHSLDLAMWSNRYGVYDDLARVKEWSAVNGGAARP